MTETFHRSFFLKGPAGRLEALLWTSPGAPAAFTAVVCHPHPLFEGTMHNKVVYRTAKVLRERGAPVLRFNFRGVQKSEGSHDKGVGEVEDVRAAVDYMAAEFGGKPIMLAGFSFGSWTGLREGCGDSRVTDLIGLGLPVNHVDTSYLSACAKRKLLLWGGEDRFASRDNVEALRATLPEPRRVGIVPGADHFFTGRLDEVTTAIDEWVEEKYPKANATQS
jgi:uncharacterized protein